MKTSTLFRIPVEGDITEAARLRARAKNLKNHADLVFGKHGKDFLLRRACLCYADAYFIEFRSEDRRVACGLLEEVKELHLLHPLLCLCPHAAAQVIHLALRLRPLHARRWRLSPECRRRAVTEPTARRVMGLLGAAGDCALSLASRDGSGLTFLRTVSLYQTSLAWYKARQPWYSRWVRLWLAEGSHVG